ncbi:MAG: DUF5027 family lipoprotein [Lachnospiraceae bacterium]|nr:DUF5027 family lipoprotein [Lachnospiraceae bacterium]
MKIRVKTAVVVLSCLCVFMYGCSPNVTGKGNPLNEKTEETPYKPQLLRKGQVHSLGEMAPLEDPTIQNPKAIGAECTVKTAQLFETPEAAGISEEQVKTDGEIHYDIKTERPTDLDVSKAQFLLCDLKFKNINMRLDDLSITQMTLVYLTPDTEELKRVGFPVYFSESIDLNGPKYYDFELPAGESKDMKVGWLVDLEECKKENLYLMYNYNGEEKIQESWALGL